MLLTTAASTCRQEARLELRPSSPLGMRLRGWDLQPRRQTSEGFATEEVGEMILDGVPACEMRAERGQVPGSSSSIL